MKGLRRQPSITEQVDALSESGCLDLLSAWTERCFVVSQDHPLIGPLVRCVPPTQLGRLDVHRMRVLESAACVILQSHRAGAGSSYLCLALNWRINYHWPARQKVAAGFHILRGFTPSFSASDLLKDARRATWREASSLLVSATTALAHCEES